MAGRNRKRMAGVCVGIAIAAVAGILLTRSALAQYSPPPGYMPPAQSQPLSQPPQLRPIEFEDANVQPAAYQPGQYPPPTYPSGSYSGQPRPVSDPPAPMVRIQVRVAADSPIGDELKYIITVQNTSAADAHGVTVRNPLPDSIDQPVKAEPEWDKSKSTLAPGAKRQLIWSFGTLAAGKSKTIELTLRPKADTTEVKNLAYVQFEHGEAVTTRLSKPSLKVSKTAVRETVRDEPYLVRVTIENTGRVIAEDVRVTENVPEAAEFEAVTRGAKRTVQPTGQQWIWELAKIMPGEKKLIEFRVTARTEAEALTLTNVSASKGVEERAEARTKVLVPSISVKLNGPTGVVGPEEAASYEITVSNTGTLTSTNILVSGSIPADCKPTMKTEGGQLYRDQIQWTIPKLEPKDAQTFRFRIKASTTGRRTITATAGDARNQKAGDQVQTMFQSAAALTWESSPNPSALSVGGQGSFTVRVRNNGGEPARDVQLVVDLDKPDALALTQITPNVQPSGGRIVFPVEVIPAHGQADYTIKFQARQAAQAWFKLTLSADCLNGRPMGTEKAVEITGGVK